MMKLSKCGTWIVAKASRQLQTETVAGAKSHVLNLLVLTQHRTGCALAQAEAGFWSIAVLEIW